MSGPARRLGADHVINARDTDPVPTVLDLTGGRGADMRVLREREGDPVKVVILP